MGSSYSEEEDITEEKENKNDKKEEENKNNSKQKDESLILVSSKNPLSNTNNKIILADNIYLDKKSNLGKKRHRSDDVPNNQKNKKENELLSEIEKIEKKNKNESNNNKPINKNLYLQEVQNIKEEYIGEKKFKKLAIEPSLNVTYSNEKIKNNKNEIDNAINFSIEKLYDNKIETNEKSEKKKNNLFNSYMLLKKKENNIKEEKKNNSEEKSNKPKQIIDNIFIFPSENSKIENKIIKIPQQSENKNNQNENLFNSIKQEEQYSYECLNENLYVRGVKGIKELSIDVNIKNNGKLDWPKEDIFLKSDDKNSQISSKLIKIISLKTGWISEERIVFNNLDKISPGLYKSYIYLNINGKNYGNPMIIDIEILENEEEKKMNNLINKMRNEYQLPFNEISDEYLKNALIKNDLDSAKAFQYLFGE